MQNPVARFSPVTKSFDLREARRRVRVGADGDAVGPFGPLRRRLGDAVVDGAQVLILLDRLEARRVGVLQVLHDPHPAALVEGDAHRLADHRLGGDGLDREAGRELHPLEGFVGREALGDEARAGDQREQEGEAHAAPENGRVRLAW